MLDQQAVIKVKYTFSLFCAKGSPQALTRFEIMAVPLFWDWRSYYNANNIY